jgi:arylsulfatase A-like enzyme
LTERQLKRMHALYSGEVTMMDRWLGNFLDKMAELNLMENTLLLFISDHGHAFGEHGVAGKVTTAMYPELMDVPLMIRHPEGKKAGSTSDYFASTHDVAPTLLAAAGLEPGQTPEGQNLNVLLDGGEPEQKRPYFTSSYHDQVWARDEDYVMISRNDGEKAQLFDLRSDPDQNKNIAWRNSDIVQRMFKEYVLKDAGGPLPRY